MGELINLTLFSNKFTSIEYNESARFIFRWLSKVENKTGPVYTYIRMLKTGRVAEFQLQQVAVSVGKKHRTNN